MRAYKRECEVAGLDPKEVSRIAAGLARYGKAASDLGLTVFGGSGAGSLRADDCIIVADIEDGFFDGGQGSTKEDQDGILRGESYFEDGGK